MPPFPPPFIEAASARAGRGATFVLALSAGTKPPLDRPPTSAAPRHAAEGPRLDNLHLLVVDDDQDSREALELLLRGVRAHVSSFDRAQDAYRFFTDARAEDRPDVILSDIAMPGEDGYALIRRIRTWELAGGESPVTAFALTAFVRNEDRARAYAAGFDGHFSKPIDIAALLDALAHWEVHTIVRWHRRRLTGPGPDTSRSRTHRRASIRISRDAYAGAIARARR